MLKIENIVKQYENHIALNDVSLTVPQGSVFGLLGPNGAGKTSLIRIVNQITAPDSGVVYFKGEKLKPEHISLIGYLPEERGLYKKMEIGEQILYLAQLKGLTKSESIKRAKYWFEKMEIESWWTKKVEELSKGMQQKVQFIATIIHEPELLILDEPFSGFDPVNADIIKNEFLELNKKGTTIIFSSHRMESVEQLCDHIALIDKSKKILEGKVVDIRNQYKNNTYRVIIRKGKTDEEIRSAEMNVISISTTDEHTQLEIKIKDGQSINETLSQLISHFELISFEEIIPSIHDIFIQNVTPSK
jgi:ABC-2 type transport system ATP-binding protein